MYCKYCGCENEEGSLFCQHCGRRVDASGAEQNAEGFDSAYNNYSYQRQEADYGAQPEGAAYGYQGRPGSGYQGENAARNAYGYDPAQGTDAPFAADLVRKSIASPLFLIGTIFYSGVLLANIISSFSAGSSLVSLYAGLYPGMEGALLQGSASTSVTTLLSCIPQLLMVIALWMTYAAAADKKTQFMKPSGLTLLRAMVIVEIVLFCVAFAVIMAVVFIMLAVTGAGLYGSEGVLIIGVAYAVFAVFAIAAFILMLIYEVKSLRAVNIARQTLLQGSIAGNIPAYIVVVSYIVAVFELIMALAMLAAGSPFAGLIQLMSAAVYVFFAIAAQSLRKAMRELLLH